MCRAFLLQQKNVIDGNLIFLCNDFIRYKGTIFVMQKMHTPTSIITFWFEEIEHSFWFKKDTDFDQLLIQRFGQLHTQASLGELSNWRDSPHGRMAEIIVLDQFSRNLFRDSAKAFAQDNMALVLAQEAVRSGADVALNAQERVFLYMPYMHSESLAIHETAVALFTRNGIQNNLDFELKHKAIIERFGRYPHRNAVLGRESTPDELAFLNLPGSSF
jgi:uncharacterized protein (DUF924 family)